MKILHVTPAFYPATYWGGPIYSVYGLCNALAGMSGVSLKVLTTDSAGPRLSDIVDATGFPMRAEAGYEVFYCSRWWGASFSPGMLLRLWPMIRWADIVHLTAVYSPPTIPTLLICRLLGKPVVWSPRGALQRWENTTRPVVKMVWEWLCNALISRRNCALHVTSAQEAAESGARMLNAELAIIPNGISLPTALPERSWCPNGTLRLLFIGRLHPIKGIENLLQAMKLLRDERVSLAICGTGTGDYVRSLKDLACRLGLDAIISFKGHVEDSEKLREFMQADICIVSSFTENFGMVVAEALAHGVPVIASKGTPWSELAERGCGLWVDNEPATLAGAIRSLFAADLRAMGDCGRAWMKQRFSWETIALQMLSQYGKQADKSI